MEIIINEKKIKLKKNYLTNAEVNFIVSEALKTYIDKEENDIEGYDYNPLTMITNFYAMLFELCIKDYNLDNIEDYNKYYNDGVHLKLLENIINAKEAYDLMIKLSGEITSLSNIIGRSLKLFIDKIPEKNDFSEILTKLPEEWQKVADEYNNIIGKSEEKEDE